MSGAYGDRDGVSSIGTLGDTPTIGVARAPCEGVGWAT
jgi:hypothetical protein